MPSPIRLLLTAVLLASWLSAADAGMQIIANPDTGVKSLDKRDLESLFFGRQTRWDNGSRAFPILLSGASHSRFLDEVLNKDPTQFSAAWKKLVFTGKASPPSEVGSAEAMVEAVRKTPGSIGYVPAGTAVEGVTVVTISR